MKKIFAFLVAFLGLFIFAVPVLADVNAVTPSTNDINRTNGWAHVDATSHAGSVDLTFISTRSFASCFEVRTDGDASQIVATNGGVNYNTDITDGLYPFYCENNSSETVNFPVNQYLEVRMVFGAEKDERFDWTRFDALYPRTAEITSPSAGENVYGNVLFGAYLDDNDVDPIQWAVRYGTCAAGTNTVYGNVDGHTDSATFDTSNLAHQTFSFTADMSSQPAGVYCFVYNPVEDAGDTPIRLTREFYLANGFVNGGGQLIEEVGSKPKDYLKISFGGWIWGSGIAGYAGDWEVNFHNVGTDTLDKTSFHATSIDEINFFDGNGTTCNDAVNFTMHGVWNGIPGYKMIFRAGDFGSPSTADTVRITLYNPSNDVVYDTYPSEFTPESNCVGTARTGLDNGNITIWHN